MEIELVTLLTHPLKERDGQLCMLRVRGEHCDRFVEQLWQNRYQVLQVDEFNGGAAASQLSGV